MEITDVDLLEKTFSTFHASNLFLQQQYRGQRFRKYFELISCLLVAEKSNKLLLRNHQSHPTGSVPIPDANGTSTNNRNANRGRGQGRGYKNNRGRSGYNKKYRSNHSKWNNITRRKKKIHKRNLQMIMKMFASDVV